MWTWWRRLRVLEDRDRGIAIVRIERGQVGQRGAGREYDEVEDDPVRDAGHKGDPDGADDGLDIVERLVEVRRVLLHAVRNAVAVGVQGERLQGVGLAWGLGVDGVGDVYGGVEHGELNVDAGIAGVAQRPDVSYRVELGENGADGRGGIDLADDRGGSEANVAAEVGRLRVTAAA